jgi:hypothetical protein
MTPGPGWRECTAYRRPGPGGMPLVLRLERKVRRSPDEATAACKPQVVQNAGLQANKEGGGSLVRKLTDCHCLNESNRTLKHVCHRTRQSERNVGVGQNKISVLAANRKRCRLPAPNV